VAYVRTSRSRGKEYRQIVESYREDGKVKHRVLVHLPKFTKTPEHAAEWCESVAERSRESAERYTREVEELAAQREHRREYRKSRGWAVSYLENPSREEQRALSRAEESARDAKKYAHKAKVIRELLESGKIKPDHPEVREERERKHAEALKRLRETQAKLRGHPEASFR